MFLYQNINDHVRILGYMGYYGSVRIPERIGNLPVTELSDYAFSGGWGREEMIYSQKNPILYSNDEGNPINPGKELPPAITLEKLEEIYLPETIEKIGNYAFYNCCKLGKLECSSAISDLGSGLFTGCLGVHHIAIHLVEGKRSCLKDILSELRQNICVDYYTKDGHARLIFPEMFEESIEHAPARITIREMHGCGHRYRYCFNQSDFQFQKFDSLFPHLLVQESEKAIASLVINRLYTPMGLSDQGKIMYEEYLVEHIEIIAKNALKEDESMLLWLMEAYGSSQAIFDSVVEMASKEQKTELLSQLMELRRQKFTAKKRVFAL